MNQAVDLDELTLFRDMARRAFEQEITPHYEEWEANRMVPGSCGTDSVTPAYSALTWRNSMEARVRRPMSRSP
ncbi:MAG: hypothetical protein CM15mP74_07910 [Halieaceae bacterium]|nr:MAG: hypothetical protein CM15mP74_07910 [Halieaceae bacterium]